MPWRAAAAVASGLLLAAAFPPMGVEQLAWVALIPLIAIARFSRPGVAFRWGFLAGLVFWVLTLAWLRRLARFETSWPTVVCAWAALAAYCALYTGAFAAAAARLWTEAERDVDAPEGVGRWPGLRNVGRLLAMACLWVGLEYLRYTVCTGFAWNALGVSQYRNIPLIQIAELCGVYGISALVVLVNGALGLTLLEIAVPICLGRPAPSRIHIELLVSMALLLLTLGYGVRRVRELRRDDAVTPPKTIRCAMVQANVPQDEKWSEELSADVRDRFASLSERAGAMRPDLIIWPETSVPFILDADANVPTFINTLAQEAGPLLVGAIEGEGTTDTRYFNSAVYYDRHGAMRAVYRKQHLVPFGEYMPLANVIPFLERFAPLGYSCHAGATGTVFRLTDPDVAFSTLICFEDAMAGLARQAVRNGARMLINQTNDGWFEDTSAAVQHMSQCIFRCVENRVPAVRCSNLGVSCIIDRTGLLDASTLQALAAGEGSDTVLRIDSVEVPAAGFAATFYTRWGDYPFAIPCALAAVVALLQGWWVGRRG